MGKKSMSNRAQVEKILQSAQKAIAKAEKSGQTVPDIIKKIASTPIKTRYSKREVEKFKYHLDPRHIAAEARKTRILSFSTNEGGTHELVVHATDKEFPRKLGKEVYVGGNLSVDMTALKLLKEVDSVVMVYTNKKTSLKDVVKYNDFMKQIDKKILGCIVV